jgi:hypothetical protein
LVNFTLRQLTSIVDGNKYQVSNEVTEAVGASTSVYVYKTVNQQFSNYASAADMEQWPTSYEEAQVLGKAFYRLPQVVRTWDTLSQMNLDLAESLRRLQSLADELTVQQGAITIDRTTVVVGG